ncbi:basic helix-loop-helix (bHLH) DNA-binding family protein [Artemisia annua]|uniref:Basic helix-loop-helix (BHLH) DNA-binding family protein n=1 Tax=Artemisia annua TaxID=35608 RepID=A0A2U1M286_ARTAN|nr:basic helix-loop-helix (bHLH) DNA-binding family protein [Artemisia annua]
MKYISSLKSQVEELNKRNQILEAGQHAGKEPAYEGSRHFSGEGPVVGITDIGESTSESRVVDLEMNARGNVILVDLVIRVLEFIKQVENASVMSIDVGTRMLDTEAIANRVILRLRIQAGQHAGKGQLNECSCCFSGEGPGEGPLVGITDIGESTSESRVVDLIGSECKRECHTGGFDYSGVGVL